MKKFLAAMLASAMTLSLVGGVTAQAATIDKCDKWLSSFGATRTSEPQLLITGPYVYDKDTNMPTKVGTVKPDEKSTAVIEYGDIVLFDMYYGMLTDGPAAIYPIIDYDDVENLKVEFKCETDEELVEWIKVVKLPITQWFPGNYDYKHIGYSSWYGIVPDNYYGYFIVMKIADRQTNADSDIIGQIEVKRKANKKKGIGKIDDWTHDVQFNVFYKNTWLSEDTTDFLVKGNDVQLTWDEQYALKFDYDDEVDFEFGSEPNEGCFTVDVSGQGKIYFEMNTDPDENIIAANPDADIRFVNFIGMNNGDVKFHRTGEFSYEMESGAVCYQLVDGKLVDIPNAGYDSSDESFYFKTNRLGRFVFADRELVNP